MDLIIEQCLMKSIKAKAGLPEGEEYRKLFVQCGSLQCTRKLMSILHCQRSQVCTTETNSMSTLVTQEQHATPVTHSSYWIGMIATIHFKCLTEGSTACRLETLEEVNITRPECFKDDNASQWKSGKFGPRSLRNP